MSISTPETGVEPAKNDTSAIWAEHAEVLRSRAIPIEFAIKHGLTSVDVGKLKAHLAKYKQESRYPHLPLYTGARGILIPYPNTALDGIPRCRIRVDRTEVTLPGPVDGSHHGEKTVTIPRYICQARPVTVTPYIPPEVSTIAGDTSKAVYIVEAPLKALSLTAHGYPAIGLGGVLAGATDKEALDALGEVLISREMAFIKWTGRTVYVVFDAGIADNPMVALGAARLALGLQREGADVRLVHLPYCHPADSDPNAGKFHFKVDQGPDDFIARNGVDEFRKLVDAAVPADPLARVAVAATSPNRTEAVARLLGELPVQAMLQQGGAVLIDQVAASMKASGVGKKAVTEATKAFKEKMTRRAECKEPEWTRHLRRTSAGGVMGTVSNALLVLANDERIKDALGVDELREEPAWVRPPPWPTNSKWVERPVTDDDATRLVAWLDSEHDLRIPIPTAHSIIDARAKEMPFHRIREYLARVQHDGTERVGGRSGPGWLTSYLGVEDSPYVRAVGRKFLVAAVARVRRPGCKLDTMLVLEGTQGKLKSSAIETLFGTDFFSDQLSEVTTKDASSDLRGKWVIEWSELDNLSRAESSAVKKYVSRKIDDYRPSYGRRNVRIPRQCVFVGTTNKEAYLKDETGNRRFWPVTCVGDIDLDVLRRDRDLLWAEAVTLFAAGEKWWFAGDDAELLEATRDEQAARRVADPWEAAIAAALDEGEDETVDADMNIVRTPSPAKAEVTTGYVLGTILDIPAERQTRLLQMRVGEVMHALGWARVQRREGGKRTWVYARPPSAVEAGVTSVTTATAPLPESGADPERSITPPLLPQSKI